MDLPEIFQQLEDRLDFCPDELALPAPILAFPYQILEFQTQKSLLVYRKVQNTEVH